MAQMNKLNGLTLNQTYLIRNALMLANISKQDEEDRDYLLNQLKDVVKYHKSLDPTLKDRGNNLNIEISSLKEAREVIRHMHDKIASLENEFKNKC